MGASCIQRQRQQFKQQEAAKLPPKLSEELNSIMEGGLWNLKACARGCDQDVNLIVNDNKIMVLKRGSRRHLAHSMLAAKLLESSSVPIPHVVCGDAKGNSGIAGWGYLVETAACGEEMWLVYGDLSAETREGIWMHLGELMATFHNIKMIGYGDVGFDGKGAHERYPGVPSEDLDGFLKAEVVSLEEMKALKSYLQSEKVIRMNRNVVESVMIHADLEMDNLFVDRKAAKISAIIDWADLQCGPRSEDFARLYCRLHEDPKCWKALLDGYSKLATPPSIKEIELRTVELLLWLLPGKRDAANKNEDNGIGTKKQLVEDFRRCKQLLLSIVAPR
eukprot:jgi/Bigna1/88447/estExt_fgenesh1_pg.C_320048